jgi:hypothetical protein
MQPNTLLAWQNFIMQKVGVIGGTVSMKGSMLMIAMLVASVLGG